MKTTFLRFIRESSMKAFSGEANDWLEWISSIKNGRFTLDGKNLEIVDCDLYYDILPGGQELYSLSGCPETVENFNCSGQPITTLVGGPIIVQNNYYCTSTKITDFKGAPKKVGGSFICKDTMINTFDGIPEYIGDDLNLKNNKFTSLKDIHKHITNIWGGANFEGNPIKSNILGLLKIKQLRAVQFDDIELEEIINKYLPEGDIFACQQELIDAGFEEYARL